MSDKSASVQLKRETYERLKARAKRMGVSVNKLLEHILIKAGVLKIDVIEDDVEDSQKSN